MTATDHPSGPWTRHGHAIAGITVVGTGRPPIARCGGPALCAKCREDETRIRQEAAPVTPLEPHHAAARHRTPDEADALAEADRRHAILARLRGSTVDADVQARAAATFAHFQATGRGDADR